jgi:hypothetical protein
MGKIVAKQRARREKKGPRGPFLPGNESPLYQHSGQPAYTHVVNAAKNTPPTI